MVELLPPADSRDSFFEAAVGVWLLDSWAERRDVARVLEENMEQPSDSCLYVQHSRRKSARESKTAIRSDIIHLWSRWEIKLKTKDRSYET